MSGDAAHVDALQGRIETVRARLTSLNSNLAQTSISQMESSSRAPARTTAMEPASPPPLTMSTRGAHAKYAKLLNETTPRASDPASSVTPAATAAAVHAQAYHHQSTDIASPTQQRQVAAAQSESRWRSQQDMLARQLDEFRRGGGEVDDATQPATPGRPGDSSAFAEMQKRLRSKLTAMGTGSLSPATGAIRRQQELAGDAYEQAQWQRENQQLEQQERDRAALYAQPPPQHQQPAPAASSTRGPRTAESGTDAVGGGGGVTVSRPHQRRHQGDAPPDPETVGVAGEELLSGGDGAPAAAAARPAKRAAGGRTGTPATTPSAKSTTAAAAAARGPAPAEQQPSLRGAGYQAPSLIGGLVGRFDRRDTDDERQPAGAQTANDHRQPPEPTAAASPARGSTAASGAVGSQEVDVSGAEVFAILRMRGVILSRGQTGEHLLPTATCHRMTLSAHELQQLNQLREALRRQQRNSPRGASARSPRTATSTATGGATHSLRATETALRAAPQETTNAPTATARRTAVSPAPSARRATGVRSGASTPPPSRFTGGTHRTARAGRSSDVADGATPSSVVRRQTPAAHQRRSTGGSEVSSPPKSRWH